jgi:hypothetical protein
MLDILKRLEEQGDSIDGNEGSDGDEFIQRFKGIDIGRLIIPDMHWAFCLAPPY